MNSWSLEINRGMQATLGAHKMEPLPICVLWADGGGKQRHGIARQTIEAKLATHKRFSRRSVGRSSSASIACVGEPQQEAA